LIDFYDSFTYNIFHYLESCGVEVHVVEDRAVKIDEVENYDCIVFSPGPGLPSETQSMLLILEKYSGTKKILGICLGMQGIASFYGDELYNLEKVKHGVSEIIHVDPKVNLFNDLDKNQEVGLYHSWAVRINPNSNLKVTALSNEHVTMALQHKELPIYGVQFHPESILSENGKQMLKNFLFVC
jgi:anthranilate synthase component 2